MWVWLLIQLSSGEAAATVFGVRVRTLAGQTDQVTGVAATSPTMESLMVSSPCVQNLEGN